MSKKSFIDSVEVGSPCNEDWNQMHGTDKIRLCSHCEKHVNNLSEMTRKQAAKLVRESNGNICIRYITDPVTKRPMFADQLLQITRRSPGIAAGVMTASMSLSTLAYSQEAANPPTPLPLAVYPEKKLKEGPIKMGEIAQKRSDADSSGSISGTVTDANGAVIPRSKITVFSVDAGKTGSTTTNDEGVYRFEKIGPGTYRIEVESPGFRKSVITQVVVSEAKENVADASLEVGMADVIVDVVANVEMQVGETTGGVMVSISYSTPLAKAVGDEEVEEVRDLISKGVDVNGKDENYSKITPLFLAVENGNVAIAEMLLNAGAKINARDKEKQTPLMRIDSDATPELVDLLVRHGAKINLTDNEGNTEIILAARDAKAEVLKALIDAGADVRLGNKDGQTALMNAVANGDVESVRALIQAGSDVNAKNKDGETVLDQAANDEVRLLLAGYGALSSKPDKDSSDERTPVSRSNR